MADPTTFEKVVSFLGVVGLGSVMTYFGTRYSARKAAEPATAAVSVQDRRLTLEEIQYIVQRHEIEIHRLEEELEESRAALKSSRSLLRLALQHIGLLRRDMRDARIEPPALPEQLSSESLPWDLNMYD
jgi:glycine cleavage system regulatory protein